MEASQRSQFVFLARCGCPIGLVEGSYAKTADGAWDCFADDRADERQLRENGVTVDHVPHDEYVSKYYPLMRSGCIHAGAKT